MCLAVLFPVEGCKGNDVASVSAVSLNMDSMLPGVCTCGDCSMPDVLSGLNSSIGSGPLPMVDTSGDFDGNSFIYY